VEALEGKDRKNFGLILYIPLGDRLNTSMSLPQHNSNIIMWHSQTRLSENEWEERKRNENRVRLKKKGKKKKPKEKPKK